MMKDRWTSFPCRMFATVPSPPRRYNVTFVSTSSAFPLITNSFLVFQRIFFQFDGPAIFLCIQAWQFLVSLQQLGLCVAGQLTFLYNGYTHRFGSSQSQHNHGYILIIFRHAAIELYKND